MSGWIIAAALGSIAVTALLTLVLWRLNAPALSASPSHDETVQRRDDGTIAPIIVAGGANNRDDGTSDGASDAGPDGGGDGGE